MALPSVGRVKGTANVEEYDRIENISQRSSRANATIVDGQVK